MLNRVPNIFLIILLIPIINVSAAILTPLFPPRALNPGVIRGLFLTVFTIWFLFTQYKSNVFGKITIVFLVYIFTLCWLSDDFNTSIYIFNKVYIASILLLIGYHYVKNPIRFLLFQRAFLVSLFLLELYVISANIFGWGFATYKDDSVFFGETGVNITKYIVIFVIGIPLYLKTEKDKQYRSLAIVLLFIGVLITFIGMKRSAILALDTVFNQEMLQKGKFGLFFKKELLSVTNSIEYCEKQNILIDKLRQESVNGITKKYNWDFVASEYFEVFNSLVSQRN